MALNGQVYTGNPYLRPDYMQAPQQAVQSNTAPASGFMTIFVNSEEEVTNYPVAAGLTVLLISFNLKKFWLKGTDMSGIPTPLRTFSFDETTPVKNQNDLDTVSRSEFNALSNKIDKLISELGGMKNV